MSMQVITRHDIVSRLLNPTGMAFDVKLWDWAVEMCAQDILVGKRPRFRSLLQKVLKERWDRVSLPVAKHMVATGEPIGLSMFGLVQGIPLLDDRKERLRDIGVRLSAVSGEDLNRFFNYGSWDGSTFCQRLALCLRLGMPLARAREYISGAAELFDTLGVK
ncbi:MAG: hypothetical protein PHE83_16685 [Opitutaceae bacterium]|nr:hypothetical protein [Opitutaceae bacterium]